MHEQPPQSPSQEELERIRKELEENKPAPEPVAEEDRVPEYTIEPENPRKTPDEVIEEEKLGAE